MYPQVRFFPVNNGDTTLIEADGYVVLTDVNYRDACTDDNEEAYDFAPELRDACRRTNQRYELDVFVLTHPDKDHLGGASKLLHLNSPDIYHPDADDPLILVREMWVSPYALNAHETEFSKPVLQEIRRRQRLHGTSDGERDGNRLKVLSADGNELAGRVGPALAWRLLAPTNEEATIPPPDPNDADAAPPSCNDSSLVIRWTLYCGQAKGHLLLAGDAGVDVWERIWDEYQAEPGSVRWHVLLAPHHCSRSPMARKDEETGEYTYSPNALAALGQVEGDGFVVSSSKPVKRDDDNPPSWEAKQRYLTILRKANPQNVERRFLNPESHNNGKPAPVVFELTEAGLRRKVPEKVAKPVLAVTLGASRPSTYG